MKCLASSHLATSALTPEPVTDSLHHGDVELWTPFSGGVHIGISLRLRLCQALHTMIQMKDAHSEMWLPAWGIVTEEAGLLIDSWHGLVLDIVMGADHGCRVCSSLSQPCH